MDQDLLYEVKDGIGRITFNRPQARNAFTFAMYERLAEICQEADDDRSIKALLLTGAGDKAFASGTDISQFKAFKTAEDALAYESRIDRVVGTLERCRVPTIAAIAGACTGGGGALAAACDLRIAAANARFGFPVARTLGNCLSMGNYARLAALIGIARAKEIIFTARLVEAEEAKSVGLVSEVLARSRRADGARRGARQACRQPRAADLARDERSAASPDAAHPDRRGPRHHPHVLHEPGFPGRHGRLPEQAPAAMEGRVTTT